MCVLTYIPSENNSFVLTSNRDEAVVRVPAIPPKKYEIDGHYVFFPKDPKGGGTWIASCGNFTLCLLNGGFEKHTANPPYRQSRGKVILDFYNFVDVEKFFNEYDFEGIEPFTLIIIESSNQFFINEIRWTGIQKFHCFYPANQAKIWSSVTLYSHEIIQERENWFNDFLNQKTDIQAEDILNFHHFGGKGDVRNDILMNRDNQLKTISITQFLSSPDNLQIRYEDLQQNKTYNYRVFMECA